jgi:hypothetical protein
VRPKVKYELDIQSVFGLLCTAVLTLAETPQLPPSLAFGLIYGGTIGQRRKTTSLCDSLYKTKSTASTNRKIREIQLLDGINFYVHLS